MNTTDHMNTNDYMNNTINRMDTMIIMKSFNDSKNPKYPTTKLVYIITGALKTAAYFAKQ